jgi:hypothetical protein
MSLEDLLATPLHVKLPYSDDQVLTLLSICLTYLGPEASGLSSLPLAP